MYVSYLHINIGEYTIILMKIEFDSKEDKELFKALIDSFISMAALDPIETVFINKMYASLDTTPRK